MAGNAGIATPAQSLRSDVAHLADTIGERHLYRPEALTAARNWIEDQLGATGLATRRVAVTVPDGPPWHCGPTEAWNVEAQKPGGDAADEVLVVGAHYDSRVAMPTWHAHGPPDPSRPGTPGANDNASGLAVLLALARALGPIPTRRTIRFVAFANEEPPFYQTAAMGSLAYARSRCMPGAATGTVVGMLALDTLGCYSLRPRRKRHPLAGLLGLPDRPDYVALLSNRASRGFARQAGRILREHVALGVRTVALPAVHRKVAWSDDWSFWQCGIPAFTVTDTAFLRSDDYHELSDRPEHLDCERLAELATGLAQTLRALADDDPAQRALTSSPTPPG